MYVTERHLAPTVARLRSGAESSSTYLAACRSRFDAVEPTVQAFVPESDRWDRVAARVEDLEDADADGAGAGPGGVGRPALYGVPVGVKDIFGVDGLPTRAGSDLPAEAFAGPAATAWRRLERAGAVALGKTVTAEFAYFDPGPTRNPHDPERTPGGSSSGSAAAVAAGLCPLALGTQTIGSVIRPAAFCGVVGFKPTYGRVPTDGVVPVSRTLDHVGTFTQDLAGARLAAAVLCDDWRTVPAPPERPTLGVPDEAYLAQADAAGREAFEQQVETLAGSGFDVRRTDLLADVEIVNDHHRRLMAAEMALAHHENEWYPEHADAYAPVTRDLVEEGEAVTTGDLAAARDARRAFRERVAATMAREGIDCWVTPAAPGPAPEGIDDTGDPVMNLPWTNAGLPTVTLPVDRTDDGLPLGLQVTAGAGGDEELLWWAERVAGPLRLLTR